MAYKDPKDVRKKIIKLQCGDIHGRMPKRRYNRAKKEAKRRGLEFKISYSFYLRLIKTVCVYCGELKQESSGWMDRLNNSLGYLKNNVVACCAACNNMRGTLPVEMFVFLTRKVARHRSK